MLLDNRTARENGEIFGKLYSGWNQKRYIEKLNEFQVDKDVCIDTLSKGNIMKVMAAFEWGHRPELLIADEPTAGFDPVFRKKFLRYLQEYVEDGEHSVIISTHITEDLDKIADYIMMIDDGKIILNDTIENIRDNYGIVKCTQEEFEKLQKEMPEENIFGYRNNGEKTEALIKIQKDICVGYDVRRPNITEILVYLTQKGENNDGQD
jgi:ABC-2 type transport system ATP-binding protein